MEVRGLVMDAGGWVMGVGGWVMDAGGWVMDVGTRPISRVGRREVRCGNTRCLLWQDKTSVVTRDKGGGLRPPPFVVPLSLATTEVLSCHNRHLVLPQRTSRVATQAGSSRFRFQPVPVPAAGTDAAVQPVRFLPGSVPPVPVRFRRFLLNRLA